jgi:hypothetical protein
MVRSFAILVCVWLLCASLLPAQAPGKAEPVSTIEPALSSAAAGLGPALDCLPPAEEPSGCLYTQVDFLLRWFKPVCLNVPVVSVGNPTAPVPGAVNQPGTQVVVGGVPPHHFDFAATPGVQFKVGWLRDDGALGVEVGGFLMDTASASQGFVATPNGSPASYLPYQAPDNSQQALRFTIPGVVTGTSVAIGSTHLWGLEANLLVPISVDRCGWCLSAALLVGGRYLDLTDRDRVSNTLRLVDDPSALAVGADQFITRNQFAGPQLGATLGVSRGSWSLEYTTKLAAGVTHQARNIEGSPVLAATASSPLLVPGPLLALPSNIGRETAERVTLVPEVGLRSRLELTSWCWVTVGYTLLYWNKVLCPGDQMDAVVNVTQLPFHGPVTGPANPAPLFVHTDYFAQGLELGVQFRF